MEIARCLGVRLVQAEPPPGSRGAALNRGAAQATGDVLLFLDADTLVPKGYDQAIVKALANPRVIGGAFEFQLEGAELGLRIVECINRVRYRLWPRYYGDQGIFVRAGAFHRAGGYPERRLLEASDFCVALARIGELALVRKYMRTSARRFLEGGIYRVLASDFVIWWLDLIGHSTERYGAAYQENNRQRGQAPIS